VPFNNYVDVFTCRNNKLIKGLPSVAEFEAHLTKNGSPNWYFQYGDGSTMTVLWGVVVAAGVKKIEWYFSGTNKSIDNQNMLVCMDCMGYTWPLDKFGNKIQDWHWTR
jgi:hypothetical protein